MIDNTKPWLKENLAEAVNSVAQRPEWMRVGIHSFVNVPYCTCLTKTPDPQYHSEDCEYKIYRESGENISPVKEDAIRSILKQNGKL